MPRSTPFSVFAIALACSVITACGGESAQQDVLTSPHPTSASRDATAPKGKAAVSATSCATRINSVNSGVFGPAGGTLTFGTSRLIIPGGALRDTVTITATIPDGDVSRVEFQPHGLQFAKPAGLQLDTTGCSVDDQVAPNVVYLSETGEVLETIEAVYDPRWHTIAATIWHFSGYAIAF
jgi:hypothetical protein